MTDCANHLEELGFGPWQEGWGKSDDDKAALCTYSFPDFLAVITFMGHMAPHIDQTDHHPEWSNVYDKLSVRLTTHGAHNGAGAITKKDYDLHTIMHTMALAAGASILST